MHYGLYRWISLSSFHWLCILHSRTASLYQPSSYVFFLHSWVLCHHWSLKINSKFCPQQYYLIASDSMSCLQAFNSNPFNSHLSPLILCIQSLIFTLNQLNYNIHFLWVPSHTGIHGNEVADILTKSSFNRIFLFFYSTPIFGLYLSKKTIHFPTWLSLW